MKKMMMLLSLPLFSMAEDWSRVFQWDSNTVGIVFEEPGLTASAQMAIQNDLAYVLSFNPSLNAEFESFSAGDEYYGKYTGRLALDMESLPEKFPKLYYTAHSGINYFVVTCEDSTNYLAQIALTNQHHSAISGLSNFVYTVNHATTNTLSRAMLAAMYWKMSEDRVLTLDDMNANAYLRVLRPDGGVFQRYTYYAPSILDIAFSEKDDKTWLVGILRLRTKEDGQPVEQPCLYRDGQWRLVVYEGN
jgi:hypothetical protein